MHTDSGKIVIVGNSGSGKSILARRLCESAGRAHLDLDTLAWLPGNPPTRRPVAESGQEIESWIRRSRHWVIEGCYSDLLEIALRHADELVFLDLPVQACIANARRRPWEPHKYESKAAQDANLAMLIEWIAQYPERTDTFSRVAHQALCEAFPGTKTVCTCNQTPSSTLSR